MIIKLTNCYLNKLLLQNKCYWPYVSNLAGYFSLPLRKNLLGSKHKANIYFALILCNRFFRLAVCNS